MNGFDLVGNALKSRAGKSTNSQYLAFQDKEKHKTVVSKVADFIGKNSSTQEKGGGDTDRDYERELQRLEKVGPGKDGRKLVEEAIKNFNTGDHIKAPPKKGKKPAAAPI